MRNIKLYIEKDEYKEYFMSNSKRRTEKKSGWNGQKCDKVIIVKIVLDKILNIVCV